MSDRITSLAFFGALRWIDGRPLVIEPYRQRLFSAALDDLDEASVPRFNLVLSGRAKKNHKSADLVLSAIFCLVANNSPGGNQCYLLANDEGQAGDDLELAKKLIAANPLLADRLVIRQKLIERRDDAGFLRVLPGQDVAGAHGKTYRFVGFDEIHAYRNWDILEAMQLDPTRADAQMWITSYASIHHKPGVPLFDLMAIGRAARDPRMLFSWYAADYTTDPEFAVLDPEARANPSRGTWADKRYLDQQRSRLPAHKFRRLHLNLPGLPEGSAFGAEPVMDAIERGVAVRAPKAGRDYAAFVDMSGGSNDDAVLAIAYRDADGRVVLARIENQGPPPPFDPRKAVERFARILREYRCGSLEGDRYGGLTFQAAFEELGIRYVPSTQSATELYEALEPELNGRRVVLLDVPPLEQQLLGLVWRGGKIDHPNGEHDDFSVACAGVIAALARPAFQCTWCDSATCKGWHLYVNGHVDGRPRGPIEDAERDEVERARGAAVVEDAIRSRATYWPRDLMNPRGRLR